MNSEFTIAVHALVYLNHKKEYVSSEKLAENICTNPARVRKIMGKLRKSGLITTKEGIIGGYLFEDDPADVSLDMVGKALQTSYVSASWKSGDSDMDCLVASGMAGIMDEIYSDLDDLCRKFLKGITIQTIDQKIFGNHERKGESI